MNTHYCTDRLFTWAVSILYTWDCNRQVRFHDFPYGVPNLARLKIVVAQAVLVMTLQTLLWSAAAYFLVLVPLRDLHQGQNGMWTILVTTACLAFMVFVITELWAYPRRFMHNYSSSGHESFQRLWPYWRRYVIPFQGFGRMPWVNIVWFAIWIGFLGLLQLAATSLDRGYLTITPR